MSARHAIDDGHDERWRHRVRAALPAADLDVVEEIAADIAERWRDARASGLSAGDADRQSEADLDAWTRQAGAARRPRPTRARPWRGWSTDLRAAARALRARPLFTLSGIALAAIAIAAVTAASALVYGILWRPLPYPDADRLAVIWQRHGSAGAQVSYPDYADLAAASVFDGATALSAGRGNLRIDDRVERVNALALEPAGFALLGATPFLGRLLTADDVDQPLAMVSHALWRGHLNSDPAIVGRVLWMSGREYTIVGVLAPGFDFELTVPPSFAIEDNALWMLLDRTSPFLARRDAWTYEVLVRRAPGRTLREAQAAIDAIGARLEREHPATNAGRSFFITPLHEDLVAPVRRPLLLVAVAAAIALGLALANLAILNLVRGASRQTEWSVRAALGASMLRLRRQALTEHLVVAAGGACGGLILGRALVVRLLAHDAANLPRPDAVRFDAPVLGVAAAVALLIAGVLAAQPMATDASALRTGSRAAGGHGRRTRRALAAAEVALAVTLATAGSLLGLSLVRLLQVDIGFVPSAAAAVRMSAYDVEYPARQDVVRWFEEVLSRVRAVPDVQAAGAGSSLPLSGQSTGSSVVAEGEVVDPAHRLTAGWQFVTPGYFAATGMRLNAGRDFAESDRARGAHVTVINDALARVLFPGQNPLGRRIGVGGDDASGDWHEVIGVVADVRHQALAAPPEPRVYDLLGQHWGRTVYVIARSRTGQAAPLVSIMRAASSALNPGVPVFEPATLQSLVDRSAASQRLASWAAMGLAAAALLLALLGVYAVTATAVAERTREIGVRAALGAAPSDLFRLIAGEGARTIALGGMIGALGALLAGRLLASQLFDVRPADAAWLIALAVVGVMLASLAAAVPPGRRAATADPVDAMRCD